MSNINQLLAKALSTASEDEAVACLRMARKKGKTLDTEVSGDYNGHDAKYWYEKASSFYRTIKENGDNLETAKTYRRMYHSESLTVLNQRGTIIKLEAEIKALKNKPSGWWYWPVMVFQVMLIIVLVQLIH